MAVIRAICISDQKGTQKYRIPEGAFTEDYGIEGDAHAGKWHRQVSLLSAEKIQEFRDKGVQVEYGAFGENLVVEGCDLRSLPVGTRFAIGEVLLEMTQIGKECHDHCAIYNVTGDCIMPREGVFAKVLHGGKVREGDTLDVIPAAPDRPFTAAVITLSDRAFRKEREDRSGPVIRDILCENGYDVAEMILLPDGEALLKRNLIRLAGPHGAGHRRGDAGGVPEDHQTRHAQPRGGRDPRSHTDHQSARQSQGVQGKSGCCTAGIETRSGTSSRDG